MQRSFECRADGSLLACKDDPILYIATIIFLLLFIFYAVRLFIVIKQAYRTSLKDVWPSLLFWSCILLNPAIQFIHYLMSNRWTTVPQLFIFLVMMRFSEDFPYIALTVIVLKFEQVFSATNYKKESRIFWIVGVYVFLFIIEVIIFFILIDYKIFFSIIDGINVITYLIAITTFFIIFVNSLYTIYTMNIATFPRHFYRNLIIGFNIVTICNLLYVTTRTFFYSHVQLSGVPVRYISLRNHTFFMGLQEFSEIFGVAIPHFITSLGILYLNSVSKGNQNSM